MAWMTAQIMHKTQPEGVEKGAGTQGAEGSQGQGTDGDDIYKGLNPMVAAELKSLRKRADEAHEKELMDVAKRVRDPRKKPKNWYRRSSRWRLPEAPHTLICWERLMLLWPW